MDSDWLYSKTQDMHIQTFAQWQVQLDSECAFSESYTAHMRLADRVLDDGNVSGYCFLPVLPSEFKFICSSCWISRDEGIHFQPWWDEGQIMKVIDLKKQPKNSRFYSLVLCTKNTDMRESHAKRITRETRAILAFPWTCKKVWHKSYTPGNCLPRRSPKNRPFRPRPRLSDWPYQHRRPTGTSTRHSLVLPRWLKPPSSPATFPDATVTPGDEQEPPTGLQQSPRSLGQRLSQILPPWWREITRCPWLGDWDTWTDARGPQCQDQI